MDVVKCGSAARGWAGTDGSYRAEDHSHRSYESHRSHRLALQMRSRRFHRLPDLWLSRVDGQRPVPEVQRAGVVVLFGVVDADVVQCQGGRRLQAESAFELGDAFGVTLGLRQRGAE